MINAKGLFALGAATFWLPEILLHAWIRHNLNGKLVTFLLPGTFLLGYVLVSILRRNQTPKPSAAIFMLLGVVFLATFAITIGATLRGAGFAEHLGPTLLGVLLGTAIPIYGFIAATYDGSLYALIFVSLCMHLIFERRNWVIPPKRATSEVAGAA